MEIQLTVTKITGNNMQTVSPIRPLNIPVEDWNICHPLWTRGCLIPVDQLQDYMSYLYYEVIPSIEEDQKRLGYIYIPPQQAYLKKYSKYYGHYKLSDGRIAKFNSWLTQLTIYPK